MPTTPYVPIQGEIDPVTAQVTLKMSSAQFLALELSVQKRYRGLCSLIKMGLGHKLPEKDVLILPVIMLLAKETPVIADRLIEMTNNPDFERICELTLRSASEAVLASYPPEAVKAAQDSCNCMICKFERGMREAIDKP